MQVQGYPTNVSVDMDTFQVYPDTDTDTFKFIEIVSRYRFGYSKY